MSNNNLPAKQQPRHLTVKVPIPNVSVQPVIKAALKVPPGPLFGLCVVMIIALGAAEYCSQTKQQSQIPPFETACPSTIQEDVVAAVVEGVTEVFHKQQKAPKQDFPQDIVSPVNLSPYEVMMCELYRREGYEAEPYICPAGYKTVGFGNVIDTDKERKLFNKGMSFSEAKAVLAGQLESESAWIERQCPKKYNQRQKLALCGLGLSIGWGRIQDKYTGFWNEIKSGKPSARWLKHCRYYTPKGVLKESKNLRDTRELEWRLFRFNKEDQKWLLKRHQQNIEIAKKRWIEGRKQSLEKLGRT